jgi:hypothetical protein
MIDDTGSGEPDVGGRPFQVGQAVALARGKLAGLTGVVERCGPGTRCLIRLDVVESGVRVLIDASCVAEQPYETVTTDGEERSYRRRTQRRLVGDGNTTFLN